MSKVLSGEGGLGPHVARKIIEVVGGQGNPPEYGFQYFTVGLEAYLSVLDREYLGGFIKEGGSAFKMVIGGYGTGKTHFLYSVRDLAWKHGFVVSYLTLSPEHSPFSSLEKVYKEIVLNLTLPQSLEELVQGYTAGIENVLRFWHYKKREQAKEKAKASGSSAWDDIFAYLSSLSSYESTSFRNAVRKAFLSIAMRHDEDFSLMLQWLKGENPPRDLLKDDAVFERIDRSTAFKMIRSLMQWTREIGFSGLVILLDEAEQIPSMSSRQVDLMVNNLREVIDECGHENFRNTMWFYAVPDEEFVHGRTLVYEALRQRLATVFDAKLNPTGVKIYLERIAGDPMDVLKGIGRKLASIYETAYNTKFDQNALEKTINGISLGAYERKLETGYKRLFVQSTIKAFHVMRETGKPVSKHEVDLE